MFVFCLCLKQVYLRSEWCTRVELRLLPNPTFAIRLTSSCIFLFVIMAFSGRGHASWCFCIWWCGIFTEVFNGQTHAMHLNHLVSDEQAHVQIISYSASYIANTKSLIRRRTMMSLSHMNHKGQIIFCMYERCSTGRRWPRVRQ